MPPAAHEPAPAWRGARTLGGDIARFGSAILLATVFGVVQVFVIPRRMDVAAYGAYRVFLLYVGYLGVLHFGLADGAFVRWAGRAPAQIRAEWPRVWRWILAIDGGILIAALAAAPLATAGLPRVYLLAFAACALATNLSTIAGYALQVMGDFHGAGAVAALGPGTFVALVLGTPAHSVSALLEAYVAAYAVAAAFGAVRVIRVRPHASGASGADPLRFAPLLHQGLPVLGANTAAGLSQFADRILVSVSVPLARFALYGFASSVMVAANAVTQALSRVALSHAARWPEDQRARFIGGFYDVIAGGFGIALAGLPLFEYLVTRSLPAYVPALAIVRALALGAVFWVAIHVVLVGTLQSFGYLRRQMGLELLGLAFAGAVCAVCLREGTPLWGVAVGATSAAIVTWCAGVLLLSRLVPGASAQGAGRFVLLVGAEAAALAIAFALPGTWSWPGRTAVYALLAFAPTFTAVRAALAHARR